ncbi:integrase catalytic domain-containing protein [Trichonephila clavipes]|uniref:Integrase catalytic domain-containing protein n=1 Tax=Trichonephila clavipes TaxID=2585209 RepID=A0A8X6T5N8_TRICX|nr:integrase catalytic domain-containing protein [Trichonephila clavipes]
MTSNGDNLIVTKKSVISTIARIFDPLGLIGSVITKAKLLFQSLWQLKLDWNDPLPSNLVSYWKSFLDALESINCLHVIVYKISLSEQSFSDSSEKAYGTALYLRCIHTSGQISVRPLCSKSEYKELEPYDITAVEGDDLFLQELKETSDFPLCALLKNFEPLDIISNCSSFTKLQRVIAWCAEATLANIRNSFWIPSARNVVRKILRTCTTCRKVSAKGSQQFMADLPARVTACRVFSQVVKAIHLELVSDLTTETFLAALKRFVPRRGRPIEIHSDNVQIEAVLNSRPICPLSNDPNDVETLTPAHFLVESSLVAVHDPDYTEIPMNRLSRWQLVQRMNQHFWRKLSSEYLYRLQQRPKIM